MDTIEIVDRKKGKIIMEVVLTYENNGNNYVIYKEIDKNDIYIAKYNNTNDDLDTNLSKEEIEFGQRILDNSINN